MTIEEGSDKLAKSILALQEQMKELDCIYKISSALHGSSTANEAVGLLIDQLPKGFRFTDQVSIRIEFNGSIWNSGDNWSNERAISSDIVVNGKKMGEVSVSLINESLFKDEPFLKEERKLLLSATSVLSNTLERISIQDDLKDSLERLTFAIDASEEGMWDWNIETGHVFFSRRWKEMLGYSDKEISSSVEEWKKRVHPEDLAEVESLLEKCLTGKTPNYQLEYRLIGKDGSSVWVLDRGKVVSRNSSGEPLRMVRIHKDLTQHRAAEMRLQRLNKLLTLMFRANEFLIHAKEEASLLNGLCDIVAKIGDFPLAWVAFKRPGEKTLDPVAVSGKAKDYPFEVAITWDESELSRSAIGKAIKTGMTVITRSIDRSPDYLPWKDTVLKYGLKASVAIPLLVDKRVIGSLVIYSEYEDAFDGEEVRLLEELAEDISFGISSMRIEAQLEHQSGVLSSIRRVNRLIVTENDIDDLIKKSAELMTGSRGFERCMILLTNNGDLSSWAASGFSRSQLLEIESSLESGHIPPVLREAMEREGVISIESKEYHEKCLTFSDSGDLAVFAKGLRVADNCMGAMAVVIKASFYLSKEERDLFSEIVDDISYAIYKLKLEKNEKLLQRRFSLFMDRLPGAVFISDSNLRMTYFNDFASKMFGFKDDWIGRDPKENYPGKLGRDILDDDLRTQNGEQIVREERIMAADGQEKILYVQKFPIPSEGDKPMIAAIALDITSRRIAEMALKRLGSVIDLSFNEMYLFDPDSLRFLQANRGATENSGYTLDELRKMTPLDLQLKMDRGVFEEVLNRLKTDPKSYEVFETEHVRKDGTAYPVEVRLQLHEDEYERVFVAIVLDITERKRSEESVQRSLESLINTLSSLVEARDPYTSGHQKRVSELSVAIARRLYSDNDKYKDIIESIRVAALLHDIGKSAVPTEILTKPVRLNDLEYHLVREHSAKGYEILKGVYFPWPIAEIVFQHHERLDGSGYPRGLKGDDIRIEARIIAVADVVEAMSSHRPYRASLGMDKALEEIIQNSGKYYDRKVVNVCLEVFDEGFEFKS